METLQQKPSQIELEENSTSWTFYGSQSKSLIVLVSRFWPGQIWSPKKFLNLPKWQWVPFQKKVSPYNTSWSNMATGSKMLAGMVEGVALLQWSTGAEKNTWQTGSPAKNQLNLLHPPLPVAPCHKFIGMAPAKVTSAVFTPNKNQVRP